jgi:hypothetical protein
MMVANNPPITNTLPAKFSDKSDQPDSGIDISEPLNSATSSTRSSPSADSKTRADDGTKVRLSTNQKC